MEDNQILKHIEGLVAEEEKLYESTDLSDTDVKRLHKIKTELDQYWDFLSQRRALRDAGKNPDKANIRGIDTVENYVE